MNKLCSRMSQTKLEEIQAHLDGILLELEHVPLADGVEMTYPELKMQLMVNYVANLTFYLSLRLKGESVCDHPVFKHLAYLRTFIERLVPLDASLKYQIDKLLLVDEEESESPLVGPNLAAFAKTALKQISPQPEGEHGRMEIDPSIIAAQIMRIQQKTSNVSVDDVSTKKPKQAKKQKIEKDSSDEEIESDFDL